MDVATPRPATRGGCCEVSMDACAKRPVNNARERCETTTRQVKSLCCPQTFSSNSNTTLHWATSLECEVLRRGTFSPR